MDKSFETKTQHFVPQFYLKQFETSTPKHVGCVHISPYRWIPAATIKGQCQESYFYGEDGRIERLLREDEAKIAPILGRVVSEQRFTADDLLYLQLLASMTYARTRKAAETAKLVPLLIGNKVVRHGIESGQLPEPEGGWKDDMLDIKGISGQLLGLSYYCMMEMRTLNYRLLEAAPGSAFLTSDHPVVVLNQFAAGAPGPRSYVGFAQAGFQLCFPLSPRLCLFFYDPNVYRVAGEGRQKLIISPEDVDLINGLQVLSAENHLYFNASIAEAYVQSLLKSHSEGRRPIAEAVRVSEINDKGEQFFHSRTQNLLPLASWSFCKLQKNPRLKLGELRNPDWSARLEHIFDDIRNRPFDYLASIQPDRATRGR